MKVYIKAVSIADLRQKYPKIPEDKFRELVNIDPTADYDTDRRGKYMPWVLKQYDKGNLKPSDYQNVTDTLSDLADRVRSRAYEQKDVNQYPDVKSLIDAHIAAQNTEVELTDRQRSRNAHRQAKEAERKRLAGEDTGDITELVSDGTWTVYTPNTWAGAISLAMEGVDKTRPYTGYSADDSNRKAEWCTAGESSDHWYQHYTAKGPLYVFINSSDPINKFQSCPAARSWWFDKHDHEHGKQAFLNFMSEHPKIGQFFEVRTVGGVQVMGTTIEGYDPNAAEITIPDGIAQLPNFKFPDSCKKVTLPDSITAIGPDAFTGTNVETVIFNNVTTIDRNAFSGSAVKNIDLSGVTHIGSSAFRNCSNLQAVSLRSDGTFQAYCFDSCDLHGTITHYPETTISACTYDNNPELTVVWKDADVAYKFKGIKELVLEKDKYPLMYAANRDRVPVRFV